MNWNNSITTVLKIAYPFIQAPMLVVTTPEMVAAASNCGCLGSLPLGYSGKEDAIEKIRAVKKLTAKPFAVNLFAYEPAAASSLPDPFPCSAYMNSTTCPFLKNCQRAILTHIIPSSLM